MIVLAVDTSSPYCSVCIHDGNEIIAMRTLDDGMTHSESLLPLIDSLLCESRLTLRDIELFAASSCPGSFTGVRIGVSAIKGLAFGSNKPCVGVSTIEALAENLRGYEGIICPVMDARRNQFYNALFRGEGQNITRLCNDRMTAYDELDAELREIGETTYLVGDGYGLAGKILTYDKIVAVPDDLIKENAASVAIVALRKYGQASDKSIFTDSALMPGYLRASQAEREANEKKKASVQ